MLIGNKKIQKNDQNWCVVLKPLKNEIDRHKVAKEISKAFRLPFVECLDLVNNTPIILLDNLLHGTALQLKQYFQNTTAELVVSNDNLFKRRCFRTVWPEIPNLTFLHHIDAQPLSKAEEEKLEQEEAIQEIRSWGQTRDESPKIEMTSIPKNNLGNRHFRTLIDEEREKLLKETKVLRENVDQMHKAMEKIQNDLSQKESIIKNSALEKGQKEKEIHELKNLLAAGEEKYQILRGEFLDTRSYFEEKITSQEKKIAELLRQLEEKDLAAKELQQEKQVIQKSFYGGKEESQRIKQEYDQARQVWETKVNHFLSEIEDQKKFIAELQDKIQKLEASQKTFETGESRLMRELENRGQQVRQWEIKALDLQKEIQSLRESFKEQEHLWQARLDQFQARDAELEIARRQVRDLQAQLANRDALQKKTQLGEQLSTKEMRLKMLVKQQEKIESEIREREEELQKLLTEQESVEREIVEGKQAQRHLLERLKKESLFSDRHYPKDSSSSNPDLFGASRD